MARLPLKITNNFHKPSTLPPNWKEAMPSTFETRIVIRATLTPTTDMPAAFNTTTPGLVKGTGHIAKNLLLLVIPGSFILMVLAIASYRFIHNRRTARRTDREDDHAGADPRRRQGGTTSAVTANRIHDARNQGIEIDLLKAGGRPEIGSPYNGRPIITPTTGNAAMDALGAKKREERERGNAMEAYFQETITANKKLAVEARKAEREAEARKVQEAKSEARMITEPETAYMGGRPAATWTEDLVVDNKFGVESHGDGSEDEEKSGYGKVVRDGNYSEAGPGPSIMAYYTSGPTRSESQLEAGPNSPAHRDAGLGRSASLREAVPGAERVDRRDEVDHRAMAFAGYKQDNGSSSLSAKERERKRDLWKKLIPARKGSKRGKGGDRFDEEREY